jgi:hypothetical protein
VNQTADPIDPRRRFLPRGQGFDATMALAYETPIDDPTFPQLFVYTDKLSYAPGDTVAIHASSTLPSFTLDIVRDGIRPQHVASLELTAPFTMPPSGFLNDGCDWPVVQRWTVPDDLPSGFYLMLSRGTAADGTVREQEHGFFVRSARPGTDARILFLAATCTWTAYNDWGGGNHYMSDKVPGFAFSPTLTTQRPFSRGFLWLPEGAPRRMHDNAGPPGAIARHPCFEFAVSRGFSKFYASAGWASYERNFAHWAERETIPLDFATQHDLQEDPALLDHYDCLVCVGHDEYWTWEMRDAVDAFVDRGGHVARFAGNFYWQIRLEQANTRQVCYKWTAATNDPLMRHNDKRRLTCNWEDPKVGRPGASTFGLNGGWGIYAGVGAMVPRGPGGFTVYRQNHWSLQGTHLRYGDILGGQANIFGYEVDGLDYEIRHGLPWPTFRDGAPENVEIVALGLATNSEIIPDERGEVSYFNFYGDPAAEVMPLRYDDDSAESLDRSARGSGMIVSFTRGAGSVFHAGTCDWVAGLKRRDHAVETVTRNVLGRFTRGRTGQCQ